MQSSSGRCRRQVGRSSFHARPDANWRHVQPWKCPALLLLALALLAPACRPVRGTVLAASAVRAASPTGSPDEGATRYLVPVRLRLMPAAHGPVVSYTQADTEELVLPPHPGRYVAVRLFIDGQLRGLGGLRPMAPPDSPNPVDQLRDGVPLAGQERAYRLEIFETEVAPEHEWDPTARGFRVLWSRELRVRMDADWQGRTGP